MQISINNVYAAGRFIVSRLAAIKVSAPRKISLRERYMKSLGSEVSPRGSGEKRGETRIPDARFLWDNCSGMVDFWRGWSYMLLTRSVNLIGNVT